MNKTIAKIAILAVVGALGISGAAATCIPAKDFGTWSVPATTYYYVYWGAGSAEDNTLVDGRFWQPGNRAGANEGSYDVSNWLSFYAGTSQWYLNGNLGDGGVTGCPAGQLVVAVTDPTPAGRTDFFVSLSNEDPPRAPVYWMGPNITFQPMPSPQVTASSRDAGNVILDLLFDDPGTAYYSRESGVPATEAISNIVLYQAKGADPGPDVANWTEIGRFAYAGGQTNVPAFTLDCTDNTITYLAAGLNFTNEVDTVHVSASVAVECDPTLADPDDKFDMIRDRGKGQKRGKPFQQN